MFFLNRSAAVVCSHLPGTGRGHANRMCPGWFFNRIKPRGGRTGVGMVLTPSVERPLFAAIETGLG